MPQEPRVLAARPNLEVREVAPLLAFVTAVLGFTTLATMGDGPDFALVERDGVSLALVASDTPGIPSTTTCYVDVDDVEAMHARCAAKGADIVAALETHPWGMRDFVVALPGGHRIAVGQRIS
ncbi:MAG TPA: VOC family protein [Acidimicrobiia bacterium]|nr:VOC family protein [Acidimicrobiia bacterium]